MLSGAGAADRQRALTADAAAVWRRGQIVLAIVATLAVLVICFLLIKVWNLPAPGDISRALTQHPEATRCRSGTWAI